MKKGLWILFSIILLALVSLTATYFIRKHKADQQLVALNSKEIISISIDDILLDNLSQVFKSQDSRDQDSSDYLQLKDILNSGLAIPAKIYLFALDEYPGNLYSIQRLKDSVKWQKFWTSYAPNSSHLTAVTDQDFVLFRMSLKASESIQDMQNIFSGKKQWTQLKNVNFVHPKEKSHIDYSRKDESLNLSAQIKDQNVKISGTYSLAQEIPQIEPTQTRISPFTENTFLSFWNALPLKEIPWMTSALNKFAAIDTDLLAQNANYCDLFISEQTTTQTDTIVAYEYDDDFNSIETKQVQQISVPIIQSAWKGSQELETILPETLFYKFYKQSFKDIYYLSTDTLSRKKTVWNAHNSSLGLAINFDKLPQAWQNGILSILKNKQTKISIQGKLVDNKKIELQGEIQYQHESIAP